jgi:hypothetical protein
VFGDGTRGAGDGAGASMTTQDDRAVDGQIRLLRGRFEAQFDDVDAARAAARDTRAVGFVTDVLQDTQGWLIVGRRQLPFPADERDRYASRLHEIAKRHGGAYKRFVADPPETLAIPGKRDLREETDEE